MCKFYCYQLNNIIDKAFSSILNTGAVTYLNYGSKLINLFDGIFSTAVTTAIFPLITEMFAKKEKNKINEFLNNYMFNIAANTIAYQLFDLSLFKKYCATSFWIW